MTYNNLVFDKIFNTSDMRNDPDPADAKEDTRERWTDLDQDKKIDIAVEYMRIYTLRCGAAKAGLLWQEALTESVTTKGMINHIGRLFVRENSKEWIW